MPVSHTHKADESDAVQRSRLFFDIVHSRPAGRVQAESTGRAADTSDVIVRVYDGVQVEDLTPTVRAGSAHTVNISLRDWCLTVTLTPILSTLLRWEIADSSTTVATKTSAKHLQTMGRPRVVIPSFVSRETDQVVLSCAMEATTNYGDWFPQSAFDNAGGDVDLAVVTRLTREGVLQSRVSDEFGDEECSLVWSQLEFKMSHELSGAELVREHARQVSDWSAVAKLEVMGILLRIEWCDGATAPVRADDRPKWFGFRASIIG